MLKVSIIIVCSNAIITIEQTLQMIINQTYDNIEYIVVDGGSEDGSLDMIEKYLSKINYKMLVNCEGIYDAINKGIESASGDIIGIANGDRWFSSSTIETVVRYFEKNDVEIIHSGSCSSLDGSCFYSRETGRTKNNLAYEYSVFFVRKRIFRKYGLFNLQYKFMADYDFILRVYSNGENLCALQADVGRFRLGEIESSYWKISKELKKICKMNSVRFKETNLINKRELSLIEEEYDRFRYHILKSYITQRILNTKVKIENDEMYFQKLMKGKNCAVFGTGELAKEGYAWLKQLNINVETFIDNSLIKQNDQIDNLLIQHPNILKKQRSLFVIIASSDFLDEIRVQLEGMGFIYGETCISFNELQVKVIREYILKRIPWIFGK